MSRQDTDALIFAANVKKYAGDLKFSASTLAEALDMSSSTLSNYWAGKRPWPIEAVPKLSEILGVTIGELFGQASVGDVVSLPVLRGTAASAGDGALPLDFDEFEPLPFPKDWLRGLGDPKNLAMIQVKGDSMFPLINSGDWVIFDHSRTGPADGVYLIRHEGELLVKRVDFFDAEIRIRSENRHWPEKAAPYSALDDAAILQIIGRVVWTGRLLN